MLNFKKHRIEWSIRPGEEPYTKFVKRKGFMLGGVESCRGGWLCGICSVKAVAILKGVLCLIEEMMMTAVATAV